MRIIIPITGVSLTEVTESIMPGLGIKEDETAGGMAESNTDCYLLFTGTTPEA